MTKKFCIIHIGYLYVSIYYSPPCLMCWSMNLWVVDIEDIFTYSYVCVWLHVLFEKKVKQIKPDNNSEMMMILSGKNRSRKLKPVFSKVNVSTWRPIIKRMQSRSQLFNFLRWIATWLLPPGYTHNNKTQ